MAEPKQRENQRENAAELDIDGLRARALIAWLEQHAHSSCESCGTALCNHEMLFASALGYRSAPRCSDCAAREIGRTSASDLRLHLRAHFARRPCFTKAWSWSDAREPACSWREPVFPLRELAPIETATTSEAADVPWVDAEWNAGDLGCGDLVLELRNRLNALAPGDVLKLVALDPGAPEDLPAWCSMTGHTLVRRAHPIYFIKRRPAS